MGSSSGHGSAWRPFGYRGPTNRKPSLRTFEHRVVASPPVRIAVLTVAVWHDALGSAGPAAGLLESVADPLGAGRAGDLSGLADGLVEFAREPNAQEW